LIELDEALHLFGAGVEVVLEHLNGGIDFIVRDAASRQLMRAGHHPGAVDAMFDVELVENAGHIRLLLFAWAYRHPVTCTMLRPLSTHCRHELPS